MKQIARERSDSTADHTPLWTPIADDKNGNPSPQRLGYESDADELFYGGAGGSGKSDLLIGCAGTRHRKSVIFRRVFPSTRDLIERSREVYNRGRASRDKDSFNESLHLWRLADDRLVEFGAMQHEKDKESHRGRARDFYGFDEITEFSESQYRFVTAWNRSTIPGQRCRVIATGNPPTTQDGMWVIRYWAPWLDPASTIKAKPGELVWYARLDDKDVVVETGAKFDYKGETITPRSRTFIPGRLEDNPFLRDTGYRAILQSLPEPLRSQMLYGDFRAGIKDHAWQVIPTAWVDEAMQRSRDTAHRMTAVGVDVARGGADHTVLALLHGTWFAPLIAVPGTVTQNGANVAQLVIQHASATAAVGVDVVGIGSSAYDAISETRKKGLYGVNFGAGTESRDTSGQLGFRNVRAEAYWTLREALDPVSGAGLSLPPDDDLKAELCSPRWSTSGGRILIEDKDEIKARIGRSPDRADAVALALYAAMQGHKPNANATVSAPVRVTRNPYG
jgi:hypothetical protein